MKLQTTIGTLGTALLAGCASIVGGGLQSVNVAAQDEGGEQVSGAACTAENYKGFWQLTAPGSVTVQRSYTPLVVRCVKDALPVGWMTVESATKPMVLGNAVFGGVIGAIVDVNTGAAYEYPPMIVVTMGKRQIIKRPPPAVVCYVDRPPVCEPGQVPTVR